MKTVVIAKALVIDKDGNVLKLRRSKTHPDRALKADLPGGQLEPGEEFGAALVREIDEETGLKVTVDDFWPLYAASEVYLGTNRLRLLYRVKVPTVKPEVNISWEHDQFDWIPHADLPDIEADYDGFYHEALVYIREHSLLEDDAAGDS